MDRGEIGRRRIIDPRKLDRPLPRAQGIASDRLGELRDDADVARYQPLGRLLALAPDVEYLADALVFALLDAPDVAVGAQGARVDADVAQPADIGVGHRLEDKRCQSLIGV